MSLLDCSKLMKLHNFKYDLLGKVEVRIVLIYTMLKQTIEK